MYHHAGIDELRETFNLSTAISAALVGKVSRPRVLQSGMIDSFLHACA